MASVKIDRFGDLYYPECPYAGKGRLTAPQRESCGNVCLHPKVKRAFHCEDGGGMFCSVVCKTLFGGTSDCPFDRVR
jgi:hypothetical protein